MVGDLRPLVDIASDREQRAAARLDAMRELGFRLRTFVHHGGLPGRGGRPRKDGTKRAPRADLPPTLRDLGISKKLSSFAQEVARLPDETFTRVRASARTVNGALRLARGHRSASSTVYFVQAIDGGPIKIGVTADLATRLRDLQIGSPQLLRLIASVPGDQRLETALHRHLSTHRLHGEWFADVPVVRAAIAEVTK